MADIYLSSVDGSDGDDGSTWALAKATLAAALTAAGAGGTVYMDNAHAETQASDMTLASPGTAASPTRVLCVDRTGNPQPPTALATTGAVTTTGNTKIIFGAGSYTYYYGITFTAASGGTTSAGYITVFSDGTTSAGVIFEACVLNNGTTAVTAVMAFGRHGSSARLSQSVVLLNTKLQFGGAYTNAVTIAVYFLWKGPSSAIQGSVPTSLLRTLSLVLVVTKDLVFNPMFWICSL